MNKKAVYIVSAIAVTSSIWFLSTSSSLTNAVYESSVRNEVPLKLAQWKIAIDGKDIATYDKEIPISNVTWASEHTNEATVAPGSKGVIKIEIDPSLSDVAIEYELGFMDNTMDENIILTVTSMTLDGKMLEVSKKNTFSGIIGLDELKNKMMLIINVEWLNDDSRDEEDSKIGLSESEPNYLKLNFKARQYTGE